MANTYYFGYKTGASLYFVLTNPDTGQIWNGSAFETPNTSNWTTYAVSMPETTGIGRYPITFPAAITTRGPYSFSIRKSTGTASPTDIEIGGGVLGWTGTSFTSLESLPIFTGFDFTRAMQKILSSTTAPCSGAGSGHVVFNDPSDTTAEFECDVDDNGNRSNLNYHS